MWKAARWKPHKLQQGVAKAKARNKVFAAGRRTGKSQVMGMLLVPHAFTALREKEWLERHHKSRRYWIVGPEYSDSEKEFRVLYDALRSLGVTFDSPGTYNNAHSGDMRISLWDGRFVVDALSAKHPETLVGEGLSGVVISEAAKLKPTVFSKFIRPALADFQGFAYMGSTPEGRNWFYRAWQAGQDDMRPDWGSWRAPSWSNPHVYRDQKSHGVMGDIAVDVLLDAIRKKRIPDQLPLNSPITRFITPADWQSAVKDSWQQVGRILGIDPEIVSLALDMPTELFKQEIAAQFNEFVGRVFKEFDEEIHVANLRFDPTWTTYAAMDYGFTNPFVWLLIQVDPHNTNVRVLREYYETGRDTEEAAAEIKSLGLAPRTIRMMFPDPAEPDRSRTMSKLLELKFAGGTGGAIKDRLDLIRQFLKPAKEIAHLDPEHEEWVPRLQIDRSCVNMIREFNVYRYPKTKEEADEKGREAPEAPMKKDDHTPEALGRFMISHFGVALLRQTKTKQRQARVGATRPTRRASTRTGR